MDTYTSTEKSATMLEVTITLLGIGCIAAVAVAVDVWAHKGCDGTRCAVCQDVNA